MASIAMLAVGVAACDSSDCEKNRNTLPLAAFMSSAEAPQILTIDTLEIAGIGAPADSVLSVVRASQAYLPLNIESHSTSYVFRYYKTPAELFDTLTFEYNPEPRFESADCGVFYRYEINDIYHTTHSIDSVTCPGNMIDNTPGANINIYFKVTDTPALPD